MKTGKHNRAQRGYSEVQRFMTLTREHAVAARESVRAMKRGARGRRSQ